MCSATSSMEQMDMVDRQKGTPNFSAARAARIAPKVVVPAALVEGVVEAIAQAARTDKIGDGKVFVLDVESALRIRTGETDAAAL